MVGPNYDGRTFPEGVDCLSVKKLCNARYDGTGGLPGFAFMLRGEDGYRFPEELNWWFGDADLLRTLLTQDRLALITRHAVCKHLDGGSQTGDWGDPEMQKLLAADQRWFVEKWK